MDFQTVRELIALLQSLPDQDAQIITTDADFGGYDVTWHVGGRVEIGSHNIFNCTYTNGEKELSDAEVGPKVFPSVVTILGSGQELWDAIQPYKKREKELPK